MSRAWSADLVLAGPIAPYNIDESLAAQRMKLRTICNVLMFNESYETLETFDRQLPQKYGANIGSGADCTECLQRKVCTPTSNTSLIFIMRTIVIVRSLQFENEIIHVFELGTFMHFTLIAVVWQQHSLCAPRIVKHGRRFACGISVEC